MAPSRGQNPRACLRCHEVKVPEAFDMGPSGKRRRGICQVCAMQIVEERQAKMERWRVTFERDGVLMRRCGKCKQVKPLNREHFYFKKRPDRGGVANLWDYRCIPCQRADGRLKHYTRIDQLSRDEQEKVRARWRAEALAKRRRDPEKYREIQRRWQRRVQADPVLRARQLENDRMNSRLRAEREGRPMRRRQREGVARTVESEERGMLPAAPLAAAVQRLIARDHLRLVGDEQSHAEAVCEGLGIDSRYLRAWLAGERDSVQLDIVDRVLTNAGWHWWDVYGDEPEDVRAKAARLLAGDDEAVAL